MLANLTKNFINGGKQTLFKEVTVENQVKAQRLAEIKIYGRELNLKWKIRSFRNFQLWPENCGYYYSLTVWHPKKKASQEQPTPIKPKRQPVQTKLIF